jgi:triacylglycerol esterase/lipase EstA (alpha/beta hydrolase family)
LAEDSGWDVRVVHYDVNTNWGRITMPLQDRAVNVLEMIESDPTLVRKDLALICHSFGGLVAKQVLRHAVDTGRQAFIERLVAIVFVGTPHQGDLKADFLVYQRHLLGSTVTLEALRAHSRVPASRGAGQAAGRSLPVSPTDATRTVPACC